MKEKRLVFLLLVVVLSVLVPGCMETESGVNDVAQISDADDQWKEGEKPDVIDEDAAYGEKVPVNTENGIEPITVMFTENDSGEIVNVIRGDTIIVMLKENPTTGYTWNLTASPGLSMVDEFYEEEIEGNQLVGAGGTHKWVFEIIENEEQNISATYKRSWEVTTGNETQFELTVNVIPEEKLIKANGTVNYIELEGGFYGITDKNGIRYDPVNLDDKFRVDGLDINFTAYPRDELMSIHMWGQLVEIRTARVIE
ncbi:protease inhibitor I42 family protein [Methanolobus halotolerans]|uniref:Proteinase inhibitor I42 chagasin domain-containing protein n=1 Tax=Methanolobus halotolerans TaxID=2052935 RepID=A0A4E0QZL4_9EURY|nr:protease inhibitor I42 family protein [Methanolobus halotolerans]TGC09214.1 hypothetical protein CUN85_07565 [Methanolobus halotolerans]